MRILTDPTPIPMFDSSRALVYSAIVTTIVGLIVWSFNAPVLVPARLVVLPLLFGELLALHVSRRHRKGELVAAWVFVLTNVLLIGLIWLNQEHYIRTDLPFQPFVGLKIIAIFLPLFCPRLRWVGWSVLVLLVATPVVQYFSWDPEMRSVLGVQEPWVTVIFTVICGILYQLRLRLAEHRLLEQLHAERAELMENIANLLVGAGHLLNTPLQTIEATVALLDVRNAILGNSIERSFATVRRVTDSLSFIESYTNWKTLDLPADCGELESRVKEFRRAVGELRAVHSSIGVSFRD